MGGTGGKWREMKENGGKWGEMGGKGECDVGCGGLCRGVPEKNGTKMGGKWEKMVRDNHFSQSPLFPEVEDVPHDHGGN